MESFRERLSAKLGQYGSPELIEELDQLALKHKLVAASPKWEESLKTAATASKTAAALRQTLERLQIDRPWLERFFLGEGFLDDLDSRLEAVVALPESVYKKRRPGRPREDHRELIAMDVAGVLGRAGVPVKKSKFSILAKVLSVVLKECEQFVPENLGDLISTIKLAAENPNTVEEAYRWLDSVAGLSDADDDGGETP